MTNIVSIDFETRSREKLKLSGAIRYAMDSSTDAICLAYALNDEPVKLWIAGQPLPSDLSQWHTEGFIFFAHNMGFDRNIWNHVMTKRYGWPELPIEQTQCTQALALYYSLPYPLDLLGDFLESDTRKDKRGKQLIDLLSVPNKKTGKFTMPEDAPELYLEMYAYCKQDVETERAIHHKMAALGGSMHLPPLEQSLWYVDQYINEKGIPFDLEAVLKLADIADLGRARYLETIDKLTQGKITKMGSPKQLIAWCADQDFELENAQKNNLKEILLRDDVAPEVRELLELRLSGAKSSLAKLQSIQDCIGQDGYIRGCFQFFMASPTHRFGGRLVQSQNLPKAIFIKDPDKIDDLIKFLKSVDAETGLNYLYMVYGNPLAILSDCLRAMICAPENKSLVCMDYSAVEARVAAWLAGEEWVLDAYRKYDAEGGYDIYQQLYSKMFGVPLDQVDPEGRQLGKTSELMFSFGGGWGAVQRMTKGQRRQFEFDEAEMLKNKWRKARPKTTKTWADYDKLARQAYANPGKRFTHTQMAFTYTGYFLIMENKAGNKMFFPGFKVDNSANTMAYKALVGQSKKIIGYENVYGGKFFHNATQGTAFLILAHALINLYKEEKDVRLHSHDEVGILVLDKETESEYNTLQTIMLKKQTWFKDLPLAAKGFAAKRYRKD
jgi:DNA polymerase bacteriophage-type